MATVKMLNMAGEAVGEIELKDDIFGIEINENAVYTVVKNYLANQRQGTQSAKTRSEVKGGGKKPYRQKGTGRARQGSRRSHRSREATDIRSTRKSEDWRPSPSSPPRYRKTN